MTDLPVVDEGGGDDGGRRRPRWVDALGLAAVVAALVLIGTIGGGGKKTASPKPTSTTTSTTEAATTSTSFVPTTSTEPPPTTERPPEQLGKLLPARTNTVLGLVVAGSLRLIDLDAGTVRYLTTRGPVLATDHGFIDPDPPGRLIPVRGGEPVALNWDQRWQSVAGRHGGWMVSGPGQQLREFDGSGRFTGHTLSLPNDAQPVALAGDDIVVAQYGSITLVRPATGERRAIGYGWPLAAGGRTVVIDRCEALVCRVDALDVDSMTTMRIVDRVLPPEAGAVVVSPDGRWVAFDVRDHPDAGSLDVIDVRTGRTALHDSSADILTFSPDGRFLFTATDGRLSAYQLASRSRFDLDKVDATAVTYLAATAR